MYNLLEIHMEKRVVFGKMYIEPDTSCLDASLVAENKRLISEYKNIIKHVSNNNEFFTKVETDLIYRLYLSSMTYRSTEGTQEAEGVKVSDIDLIKGNVERKILLEMEEGEISFNIMKLYENYELPTMIDVETIKGIHKQMFNGIFSYKAGKIRKKGDNDVMIASSNKKFISSVDVNDYLTYYVNYINSTNEMDPIVRIAMIHAILLGIHPFKDGNGRVVRLLTDKLLSKLIDAPLFVSEMINKTINTQEYAMALDSFHLNMESSNIIHYFYDIVNKQIKNNIENIKSLSMRANNFIMILSRIDVLNKKYINRIAIILASNIGFNIKGLEQDMDISRITAKKIIDILLEHKCIRIAAKLSKTIIYEPINK